MAQGLKILLSDYAGHAFTAQLARGLAHRGHDVTYVYFAASTETPKGETDRLPDDPATLRMLSIQGGERLIKGSFWKRRRQDLHYAKAAARLIEQLKPHVVLSACSPPEINLVMMRSARRAGSHFVNWLQDIWSIAAKVAFQRRAPIMAIAAGIVLDRMERRLVRKSDANIVICDEFRDLALDWGAAGAQLSVLPNWGVIEAMPVLPKINDWSRQHGLHDKVCLIYSGTLGLKHNPQMLADLAAALRSRADVRVIVISEGEEARKLADRKERDRLENLVLLPFQPFSRYAEVIATADVLIGLLEVDAGAFCVPSKVLSYLCAGRALLLAMPRANLAARIVEDAGAGLLVAPGDVARFVALAEHLIDHPETRSAMGAAGRQYAERTFSQEVVTAKFEAVFDAAMKNRPAPCVS